MEKLLDTYLKMHGVNRNRVAVQTNVATTTLVRASTKPALEINSHVLAAVGQTIGKTPGQVLDDLIALQSDEDVNRSKTKVIPYYVSKAEDFFTMVGAPNADPIPLARWAQTAEKFQFAIVTSRGKVVGFGKYVSAQDELKVPYVDKKTAKKFNLTAEIMDMALVEIKSKIGEPVVAAKESEFHGQSSHMARTKQTN